MPGKPPYTHAQLKQEIAAGERPLYTPAQLKRADEKTGIIQLISGTTAKGEDFYAYVSMRPSMYEEFMRKMADGEKMDIEPYGKVLKKGFGAQPSDDVKQFMEEQYGFDPDYLKHVAEEYEKLQKAKK